MAVTDGVFDEGTFDNATFNNVSRSETVSTSDSISEKGDFFRDLSESFSLATSKFAELKRSISESITISDNVAVTIGPLSGTVTLDSNVVQGADVYAYNNTDGSFLGKTTTDSNGDYRFNDLDYDQDEILVAVDFDDSGTRYGSEKSILIDN